MKKGLLVSVLLLLLSPLVVAEELIFTQGGNRLSGHYLAPTHPPAKAVIIFVHGDGATPYNAEGFYEIFWQPLRENGYAVFSWDKPGVGNSTGQWLNQTLYDRQLETLAAVKAIQETYGFHAKNTGLMGFSQAGWVIPAIAQNPSQVGFVIGVGFATNWVEQGRYFTKVKHALAGDSPATIAQALVAYQQEISFLMKSPSYEEYVAFAGKQHAMSPERFQFVLNNFKVDATHDYAHMRVPGLLLWGEEDLNVDAKAEFNRRLLSPNPLVTSQIIPDANHGLLNAQRFDTQLFGMKQWLKLMWYQQEALAPAVMPTLFAWLSQQDL